MHFSTAFVLSLAGLAAAQSSTSAAAPATSSGSVSGCGTAIDLIIKSCLASTEPQLKACAVQDWRCMCQQSKNVLTCYNNCPSDPNAFGAQQTSDSYCNAAKNLPSSSSSAATGRAAVTAASSQSATKTRNPVHTGFASASGSSASASATGEGAAAGLVPAGGLLAAALGLALF